MILLGEDRKAETIGYGLSAEEAAQRCLAAVEADREELDRIMDPEAPEHGDRSYLLRENVLVPEYLMFKLVNGYGGYLEEEAPLDAFALQRICKIIHREQSTMSDNPEDVGVHIEYSGKIYEPEHRPNLLRDLARHKKSTVKLLFRYLGSHSYVGRSTCIAVKFSIIHFEGSRLLRPVGTDVVVSPGSFLRREKQELKSAIEKTLGSTVHHSWSLAERRKDFREGWKLGENMTTKPTDLASFKKLYDGLVHIFGHSRMDNLDPQTFYPLLVSIPKLTEHYPLKLPGGYMASIGYHPSGELKELELIPTLTNEYSRKGQMLIKLFSEVGYFPADEKLSRKTQKLSRVAHVPFSGV